jgi:hypothetical protein
MWSSSVPSFPLGGHPPAPPRDKRTRDGNFGGDNPFHTDAELPGALVSPGFVMGGSKLGELRGIFCCGRGSLKEPSGVYVIRPGRIFDVSGRHMFAIHTHTHTHMCAYG